MLSDFELDAQVPDSIHPYALTGTLLFTGALGDPSDSYWGTSHEEGGGSVDDERF